jgi:hypothetical protein
LVHHGRNGSGCFVGEKIGNPDDLRLSVGIGDGLYGAIVVVSGPPAADRTTRGSLSSIATIVSRATVPLPNVTIRAPGSSRVSVTNPGTNRVCKARLSSRPAQEARPQSLRCRPDPGNCVHRGRNPARLTMWRAIMMTGKEVLALSNEELDAVSGGVKIDGCTKTGVSFSFFGVKFTLHSCDDGSIAIDVRGQKPA